ncbi:MAG: maltose alpha-D-glucosyltransferase [Gammaproteobacteria bacterium]
MGIVSPQVIVPAQVANNGAIDRSDALWFKDAIVYQLHVKAFYDADNDGSGDFRGLLEKLDYIESLGVTAIWLLPFYPSPLRDDGYDIADYRSVNPRFGSMRDFRRFVRAAHDRGLRVITELVINHTSDQHRWFQRARRAKQGSAARNFYVWSDSDQKYPETRIIFIDTESSNWAWDPEAQAYYWHRFYAHQPDLNFDNPRVLREILNVLHHWLSMGVDGLRLDAVPYLCEREGTNNENLAETHAILKKIRAEVDRHYPDRMLLAEANQWPEDTQQYFGDGDECHMAFHFPLMPRIYMAIAQEDRHPITDIMRQTPEIPANCQWAIFLRNHDELTLEMVTDQERDYLWNFFAGDARMRLNLGIRRRLAPLMDNDRRKIELLNSLLLSMPGTPIVYYGDEIGMGDNIYLGDRDGVRTPMQWTPDRNGGFSRADPARLYLPAVMDPGYGYEAINVEAQQRSASSLLNWTKQMIGVRRQHKAFGRGTLRFVFPGNRKIYAYLREHDGEVILCVVNLSRSAQAVELDLREFRGRVPIEILGREPFPPIGELPYLLTLTGHGFLWFLLEAEADVPRWHQDIPAPPPEFVTLVLPEAWRSLRGGREEQMLLGHVLPEYLPRQRWFAAKDSSIESTAIPAAAELPDAQGDYLLALIDVHLAGVETAHCYFLPLGMSLEAEAAPGSALLPFTLAKLRQGRRTGPVFDAMGDPRFALAMLEAMRGRADLGPDDHDGGRIRFSASAHLSRLELPSPAEVQRMSVEQSNTSVIIGQRAVLKVYRRLHPGTHPEIEIGRFLSEVAGFANTPAHLGAVEHLAHDGTTIALGVLQAYVANQGDGWSHTLNYLTRMLDEARLTDDDPLAVMQRFGSYLEQAGLIGRRTAELHLALAGDARNPAFRPEPVHDKHAHAWRRDARRQARSAFAVLRKLRGTLDQDAAAQADALLARRGECFARIDALTGGAIDAAVTRLHGDYHLGQVLIVEDDIFIIDFEGEPARGLDERRRKGSPLRDVAGMLRSFDYAAAVTLMQQADQHAGSAAGLRALARAWREALCASFLEAYRESAAGSPGVPRDADTAARLIKLFVLEKACYEICYEAANRPKWLAIPIGGVLDILDSSAS